MFKQIHDIGLYPVVNNSDWVKRLAILKVKTIQLRLKDLEIEPLETEIITSINIAKQYGIRLFINDHWQLAIKHNATGVHLGQEDLLGANISEIHKSGLMLGISTHDQHELEIAKEINPSYIALGPIFPTTSKIMNFAPQGINKIHNWKNWIKCPLVVIGGINLDNIDEVLKTGQKDIALISAITKAHDPENTVKILLQKIASC